MRASATKLKKRGKLKRKSKTRNQVKHKNSWTMTVFGYPNFCMMHYCGPKVNITSILVKMLKRVLYLNFVSNELSQYQIFQFG